MDQSKHYLQTALLVSWLFSVCLPVSMSGQTLVDAGSWKISATAMVERVMLDRISYKQTGVETSWIRFSRPFFGVGIQAKLLSQKRPEGAGYGSFTLMPHVSILAENAEIWPVLINLGPSYYYQFK